MIKDNKNALEINDFNKDIIFTNIDFNYDGNKIANFEMESSALYFLGQSLGHNTLTICAIIGNRINKTQSSDYKSTVDKLIIEILERI